MAPGRAPGGGGRPLPHRDGRGRETTRPPGCKAISTRPSSVAAPPSPRDPAGGGGAIWTASTSPWTTCTPTPRACWTAISRTESTFRPGTRMSSSSAEETRAPTASGPPLRHGCRSLVQFEILSRPPRQPGARTTPWPQWPRIYRMDYGQEEARRPLRSRPPPLLHHDRQDGGRRVGPPAGGPHRGDPVVAERARGRRSNGFREPSEYGPPNWSCWPWDSWDRRTGSPDQLGLERDPRSNIKADTSDYATTVPGIFAAGDVRRGQSLVVWAIREGREAARECDRFLMGSTRLP